jgi:hypothetical protein
MKAEFKIYKEGTTDKPITILSKEGELFDKNAKIAKYKSLGYQVSMIDETWQEVDLSGFFKDNPTLISDLKKKYKI